MFFMFGISIDLYNLAEKNKKRKKKKEKKEGKKKKKTPTLEENNWQLKRLQINLLPPSHLCDMNCKELKLKEKCT